MMISANAAIDKPKDEFRIAILGDSFCATTTSDVTWPEALEQALNKDEGLKKQTGKSVFKVLNFGLDGTGIVQWPNVYKNRAAQFNPDLLIVNFISDDILREFIYRNTLRVGDGDYAMFTCTVLPTDLQNRNCQNGLSFVSDPTKGDYMARGSRIKNEIYTAMIRRLPWFSPYPELLSSVLGGRLGLKPGVVILPSSNPHYATAEVAVEASYAALNTITWMHSKTLIFFHPTLEQCLSAETPPIVIQLMERAKGMSIINMLTALPLDASQDEINKWYNVPDDGHPSSYGASVYAHAADKQIADFLANANAALPGSQPTDSKGKLPL
jgi:hypothetical protein